MPSDRIPLIEFAHADLGYSNSEIIVRDVSLQIAAGQFLGIVGPNGSGKTTFLRSLLGLITPIHGSVKFGAPGRRLRFGYVPQRDSVDTLFPLPVIDIVLMGQYSRIGPLLRPGHAHRAAAMQCLERVGLAELSQRDYSRLSGGQRQRVLIARALASEPEMLVLDEPTHGMDMPSEVALLDLITHLHATEGLTIALVSHLLGSVVDCSERIAILANGSLSTGSREEMLTAENLSQLYGMEVHVQQVHGRTAVVPGRLKP